MEKVLIRGSRMDTRDMMDTREIISEDDGGSCIVGSGVKFPRVDWF